MNNFKNMAAKCPISGRSQKKCSIKVKAKAKKRRTMESAKRTQHERGKEEFKFIPRREPASPDYIGKGKAPGKKSPGEKWAQQVI